MIRTQMSDGRGGVKELTVGDPEYWEGPYRYEPYPKALYRATGPERQDIESKIVRSDDEREKLGSAWAESPDAARAYLKNLDNDVAKAAAEAAYAVQSMSDSAKREFQAQTVTDEMEMTTDVPAPKKRGRPFKVQPA